MANDPGLGWHLKSGLMMLDSGTVFRVDPFLATSTPLPWVADQWLGSVLLAWLFQLASWPAVYAAIITISLLGFFGILFNICYCYSRSVIASGATALFAYHLSTVQIFVRPLVFSIVLFIFLYGSVARIVLQTRNQSFSLRWHYLLLPLLFCLWASIHPYFVLGLILMTMALAGMLFDSYITQKTDIPPAFILKFLALIALCAIATVVNPYGTQLHVSISGLGLSEYFTNLLSEWKPLNFTEPVGILLEEWLFICVCGYLFSQRLRERLGFFEFFSFFGFLHFTLSAVRGIPLLVVVSAPIFATALLMLPEIPWLKKFPLLQRFFGLFQTIEEYERSASMGRTSLTLVCATLLVSSFLGGIIFFRGDYGLSNERFPKDAIKFLTDQVDEQGGSVTVFNEINWGGAISLLGYPKLQYFIDDRLTLQSEEFYRQYFELYWDTAPEEDEFPKADFYLVKPKGALMKRMTRQGSFQEVYRDQVAVVMIQFSENPGEWKTRVFTKDKGTK